MVRTRQPAVLAVVWDIEYDLPPRHRQGLSLAASRTRPPPASPLTPHPRPRHDADLRARGCASPARVDPIIAVDQLDILVAELCECLALGSQGTRRRSDQEFAARYRLHCRRSGRHGGLSQPAEAAPRAVARGTLSRLWGGTGRTARARLFPGALRYLRRTGGPVPAPTASACAVHCLGQCLRELRATRSGVVRRAPPRLVPLHRAGEAPGNHLRAVLHADR